VTLFGQVNYTGKMYTMLDKISSSNPSAIETRQNSLTTVGLGGKYRFPSGVQMTIGCNDIFNRGPKVHQRYSQSIFGGLGGTTYQDVTADYPLQGRTWYATVQYDF
jgi:vitamin B12 transporter